MIYEPVVEEGNPLGMPRGSIRAILTLVVVVGGGALIGYMIVAGRSDEIPREVFAVVGGVLGAYFIERSTSGNRAEVKALRAAVVTTEMDNVDLIARMRAGDQTIGTGGARRFGASLRGEYTALGGTRTTE